MRNKLIFVALAIVLALGLLWYYQGSSDKASDVQQTLEEDTEEDGIVSASGALVPVRQAKLGFARPGKVKRIPVQVGDVVRAGQTLVELDTADLQAEVEAAQEAVNLARAQLAQVGGASETDREAAVAGVEAARERLRQAEAGTAAQEKTAEAKLEAAKAKLEQLLAGATADDIKAAELQLEQARNSLWAAQIERDGLKGNPINPEYVGKAADAKVAAAETAVKIAETNLLKLKEGPSAEEVRIARAAVAQAEAELAVVRDTKEATLAAAVSGLRSAEVRLAQLNTGAASQARNNPASNIEGAKPASDPNAPGPTQPEVEAARARVRQAEGLLRRANAELEQATLVAPFEGTVASVAANEGEVVTPGTPVVVLGDLSNLRIETTDLRETSVAKVRVGQPVEITFDAFPERVFKGRVTRIAPMATAGAGGTNYTATIELEEQDSALRWGMTANVDIDVR